MASLKDYLQNFAKASSGLSSPGGNRIVVKTISSNFVSGSYRYTAPTCGFLCLYANGTRLSAEAYVEGKCATLSTNPESAWARCFIPCNKGERVTWAIWGSAFVLGEVYFVKTIGSQ